MSIVTLLVNGVYYSGWKSVSISRDMEAVAGSFDVSLAEPAGVSRLLPALKLKAGDGVRVFVEGSPLLNGFVDRDERSISAGEHSVRVSGRDRTAELVDASATNVPGTWTNAPLEVIASAICAPFAIPVITLAPTGGPIKKFALQRGESAFAAIERAAKSKKVLLTTNGIGALVISKPAFWYALDALLEGDNVLKASYVRDNKERFSRYIVYGQQSGQPGRAGSGVKAENPDHLLEYGGRDITNIAGAKGRHRPLVIIAEGQINLDQAYRRAEWETAVRRARSESLSVTVQGWRQRTGPVWSPNRLVTCQIPSLEATGVYLITAVQFELGEGGTLTHLTLRNRDAFQTGP